MHGRPRRPAKPEDEAASSAKAAKLRDLQAQVLQNHHSRTYTKEAIGLSFKLLEINPEAYTAWNYRKLAFQHNIKELYDPEAIRSAADDELRVVEVALRQNPKSYGAWYHRKWLLNQKLAPVDSKREFGLLDKLLKVDARNFHGWNYRRFLARFMGVPDEEELKYTMDKISDNFSNYSAWHNRSILLSNLLIQQSKGLNQSSVKLKSDLDFGKDIRWRALSVTDSGYSNCWATHLQIANEWSSSQQYSVDVSIPCSDDIVSRSGSTYNCPVHLTFAIELISDEAQDIDLFDKPVSWNRSESFQPHENHESMPFDLLKITSALVEEDSNWHFERLSEEIDLFRELPDDNSKFVKLTLARLLLACAAIKSRGRSLIERKRYCEEAMGYFSDLIRLDPSHKRYYEDERSLVLMDKVWRLCSSLCP
ncbi:hypothetical protein PVAP13_4NG303600 [Panicum virgatum]|uniref:Geranylgeranyl transferase type-2 subunit alpha n=1 Tax=Panicum virgatum TaxID=38727 RepID=A0A8T0TIW9_PANVG|nr:hypothetical protein PVAP13_4NG303600 [Panicum virgatum]